MYICLYVYMYIRGVTVISRLYYCEERDLRQDKRQDNTKTF